MGIISSASGASCWRGLDYYKNKKIKNLKKINDYEFTSTAIGTNNYDIYLDVSHPRMSTCTCPLATGKRIVCKHIVATFLLHFQRKQKTLRKNKKDYKKNMKIIKKSYIIKHKVILNH